MASGWKVTTRLPSGEQEEAILAMLKAGNYVSTALDYTGIPKSTFYQWIKEGEREDGRGWCKDFADKVKNSRAHAQAANLQIIQKAAHDGTWQAAAWFLERSNPGQWALHQRHEIDLVVSEETRTSRVRLNDVLDVVSREMLSDKETITELDLGEAG